MATKSRGLNNIRTLSSRVNNAELPYRGYMQITALEMEKARRCAERASAARRIADIDARLRELENEKAELLAAVAAPGAHASKRLPGLEVRPAPVKRSGGFRIRY